jgi:hypothetical protein
MDEMGKATDGAEAVSLARRPPFAPREVPGIYFCQRLSKPLGHNAASTIRPVMKL